MPHLLGIKFSLYEKRFASSSSLTRRRRIAPLDLHHLWQGRWSWYSLSLCLPLRQWQGRGTLFLHSSLVVKVRFCLMWCVVRVVGAASGRINLPQLYSHVSGDGLLAGVSELTATCASQSFGTASWSSRRSSDLARSNSRCIVVIRDDVGSQDELVLLER
jgi:hypothetical protein